MPDKSLWTRISSPAETYTDGYGQTREIYEPSYISLLKKAYNAANRFFNGPSDEWYLEQGLYSPNKSSGVLELLSPAGPMYYMKLAKQSSDGIKTAKSVKELRAFLKMAKESKNPKVIKEVETAISKMQKEQAAAKANKAAIKSYKSSKINSFNSKVFENAFGSGEVPEDIGYFKGILKNGSYKFGGILKRK